MKKKILIVDDEVEIVNILEEMLSDNDKDIITAYNAKEALDIILKEKDKINLVISDLQMPLFSGIQLLESMRSSNLDNKIIFYTGFGDKKLMRKALSLGANDFINKPNIKELLDSVDKNLKEDRVLYKNRKVS